MAEAHDRINAAALLLARGAAQQPALACGDRSVAYGELRQAVARAATAWHDRGVSPGEVVMLRGDHGIDHVIAFLGAMWAGAVPVPLRTPREGSGVSPPAPVRYALERARARGHGAGATDGRALAWTDWRHDLHSTPAGPAVSCDPWAPACWSDPRSWDEGSARVLPHRFALALIALPGLQSQARSPSMLAVLRALRRGVTAVLQPHWHGEAAVA